MQHNRTFNHLYPGFRSIQCRSFVKSLNGLALNALHELFAGRNVMNQTNDLACGPNLKVMLVRATEIEKSDHTP